MSFLGCRPLPGLTFLGEASQWVTSWQQLAPPTQVPLFGLWEGRSGFPFVRGSKIVAFLRAMGALKSDRQTLGVNLRRPVDTL